MTLKGRRGKAGERKMTKHLGVCQAEGEGLGCEQPHKDENLVFFLLFFFFKGNLARSPFRPSALCTTEMRFRRVCDSSSAHRMTSCPVQSGWKLERHPSAFENISTVPRPTCARVFARVLSEGLFVCSAPAWQDTRGIPQNATYHLGCCLFPPARNAGRCHFLCVCVCVSNTRTESLFELPRLNLHCIRHFLSCSQR